MLLSLENIDAYQKLFGMNDRNMAVLEQELSVVSALRGQELQFRGDAENVAAAETAVARLIALLQHGETVDPMRIRYVVSLVREGKSDLLDQLSGSDVIAITHRGRPIRSKTLGQRAYVEAVREAVKDENAQILVIAAQTESEIAELETYEERQMFLQEIGLEESGVNRLIKSAYALLNLETFLTAGPKEVRAWTFHKGSKAPQCAGVIHTDFERGFIRAEIIKYEDYIAYGSEAAVKEAGKMHIEGKEYVFQDGDIVVFRFNV